MCFTPDGNAPSMCRSDSLKFFRSISLNSYRNGTHLNSSQYLKLNHPYGVETDKKSGFGTFDRRKSVKMADIEKSRI